MRTMFASTARGWEVVLGLLFPNVCQVCREEPASVVGGFVGQGCQLGRQGVRRVVPPYCRRCGLPFAGEITEAFRCANCAGMALFFETARAAVVADGVVRDVIHRYKYRGDMFFEPFLTQLLIGSATAELRAEDWQAIVPIPLHPLRRRERSFNQAEQLGRALAANLGLPLRRQWLERTERTRPQARLTRDDRAANVSAAFRWTAATPLSGENVILVDDVLTTGATANACARVLRENGAGRVCVWTVARGT